MLYLEKYSNKWYNEYKKSTVVDLLLNIWKGGKMGMAMKSQKIQSFFVIILLTVSFLLETYLKGYILVYIPPIIIFYAVLAVCLLLILKPCIDTQNFFKVIGIVLLLCVMDNVLSAFLSNEIPALIYEIHRPIIIIFFLYLAFYLVAKVHIKLNKTILILSVCAFVYRLINCVLNYIYWKFMFFDLNITNISKLFYYLDLISKPIPSYSIIVTFCCYILIYLVFLLMLNSVFMLPEKAVRKNKNDKSIEDEEAKIHIPDGMWRCMGCGEFVPNEKTECDCGYKRYYAKLNKYI